MALQQITPGLSQAEIFARINAAVTEADKVAGVQTTVAGLLSTVSGLATQAALNTLSARVDQKLDASAVDTLRGRDAGLYDFGRPGDGPWYFTPDSAVHEPSDYPPLDPAGVVDTPFGRAYELTSAGRIFTRKFRPVEQSRIYRDRVSFYRPSLPLDPEGDAVRAVLHCCDGSRTRIASVVLREWATDEIPTGVAVEFVVYVAAWASTAPDQPEGVQILPAATRSTRIEFRTFGGQQSTRALTLESGDAVTTVADIEADRAKLEADRAEADADRAEAARTEAQTAAASGRVSRPTKADLDAVLASYPEGTVGVAETGTGAGEYVKRGGAWVYTGPTTSRLQSEIDILDRRVPEGSDPDWALQDVDSGDHRRFGVRADEIAAPNIGLRHKDGVAEVRGPGGIVAMGALVTAAPDWAWAVVDEPHRRVLFGQRDDGTVYPPLEGGEAVERAVPLPAVLNRGALRNFNLARSRLGRGSSAKMRIGFIGDSFTASAYRWLQNVVYGPASIYGRFGDGGAGWVSFVTGNGRGGTGFYTLRRKLSTGAGGNAGGQDSDAYWQVARRNTGNAGPDITSVTPLQAGTETDGQFTLTSPDDSAALSSVRLIYRAAAPCTLRYRWNGGAWAPLTLATSGGPSAIALVNLPSAPGWTLDLQAVSGGTELYGLMLDGPASGANVSVMGVNGSATTDWIDNDAAAWRQSIALLGIKTFFVMLGTNDQGEPNSPATFIANIREIVTRLRAADPACDVGILVPPENFDPARTSTPMAGYEAAVRDLCKERPDIAGLIMQSSVGVAGGDYSATGAFPAWDADAVHPDPNTGGALMADFFLDAFIR